MKGSQKVIDSFNKRLAEEFGAYHQYAAHESYALLKGYDAMAERIKKRKKAEGEHIKEVTERILFLGGVPSVDMNTFPGVHFNVEGIDSAVELDDTSEASAITGYNETAAVCMAENDFGSLALAMHILSEEEEHKKGTEADLTQIGQMNTDNWLANQA